MCGWLVLAGEIDWRYSVRLIVGCPRLFGPTLFLWALGGGYVVALGGRWQHLRNIIVDAHLKQKSTQIWRGDGASGSLTASPRLSEMRTLSYHARACMLPHAPPTHPQTSVATGCHTPARPWRTSVHDGTLVCDTRCKALLCLCVPSHACYRERPQHSGHTVPMFPARHNKECQSTTYNLQTTPCRCAPTADQL